MQLYCLFIKQVLAPGDNAAVDVSNACWLKKYLKFMHAFNGGNDGDKSCHMDGRVWKSELDGKLASLRRAYQNNFMVMV